MTMPKHLEKRKIGLALHLKVVLQMMEVKVVKMKMKRWKMNKEKNKSKNQIKKCKTQAKSNLVMLHLRKSFAEHIKKEHLYQTNVFIKETKTKIKTSKVMNLMKTFKKLVVQLKDVLECKIN